MDLINTRTYSTENHFKNTCTLNINCHKPIDITYLNKLERLLICFCMDEPIPCVFLLIWRGLFILSCTIKSKWSPCLSTYSALANEMITRYSLWNLHFHPKINLRKARLHRREELIGYNIDSLIDLFKLYLQSGVFTNPILYTFVWGKALMRCKLFTHH